MSKQLLKKEPASETLVLLEMAMTNSEVDIAKMEKIMEMVEKQQAKIARQQFYQAMSELQSELPEIDKDGKIVVKGRVQSEYARYETIMRAIRPLLKKHGFSVSFRPEVKENRIVVKCVVSHKGGHTEESNVELPFDNSGNKNTVQSYGSTMSYGKRYALCLMFNIPVGGEDDDGNQIRSPEEIKAMLDKVKNLNELKVLWDGLTVPEQEMSKEMFAIIKKEL